MHMVFGDKCAETAPRLLRPGDSLCTLDHRKGRQVLNDQRRTGKRKAAGTFHKPDGSRTGDTSKTAYATLLRRERRGMPSRFETSAHTSVCGSGACRLGQLCIRSL